MAIAVRTVVLLPFRALQTWPSWKLSRQHSKPLLNANQRRVFENHRHQMSGPHVQPTNPVSGIYASGDMEPSLWLRRVSPRGQREIEQNGLKDIGQTIQGWETSLVGTSANAKPSLAAYTHLSLPNAWAADI